MHADTHIHRNPLLSWQEQAPVTMVAVDGCLTLPFMPRTSLELPQGLPLPRLSPQPFLSLLDTWCHLSSASRKAGASQRHSGLRPRASQA